jgi:RNA polymerase sigma factor (sigma-70 family)
MDQRELLRNYRLHGSESAFAELVRLHLDLVHSTARRWVQDADLASDVCQAVFLRLARNAAAVRDSEALAGWLYRATRFEAANLIRSEQRRRKREAEAMRRTELNQEPSEPWETIHPLLEEAMGNLKPQDQNAVLLRFFERKSLAEVARGLGLTEEATRKRVSRSLEQLQQFFVKRGVVISPVALGSLLAAHAVDAAPSGLAASITAATLACGGAIAGSTGLFTTSALIMTKTTWTLVALLVVGVLITPVLLKRYAHDGKSPNTPATETTSAGAAPPHGLPAASSPPRARPTESPREKTGSHTLLARVANLAPLTAIQIDAYVEANRRNAESLLAAYRASTNLAYLTEAAQRFPGDPDVQYAVITSHSAPDSQRQWIEAYKTSSPDNALPEYLSALEYYRAGDTNRAVEELLSASRKQVFRADFSSTLQAMQELQVSAGRAEDEARVSAFQECASIPHLIPLRELANAMESTIRAKNDQGDQIVAQELIGAGLTMGSHLSEGGGSQTIMNQLIGFGLQRKFLSQLDPAAVADPLGRPIEEVRTTVDQQRGEMRELVKSTTQLLMDLDDAGMANYMERVKLQGEEAALLWLKAKHGKQ